MCESGCVLRKKEGQSTTEMVRRQGAWTPFRYKTDPKKAKVLQGGQLSWTGLRKFARAGFYKGSPITYKKCQDKSINGQA